MNINKTWSEKIMDYIYGWRLDIPKMELEKVSMPKFHFNHGSHKLETDNELGNVKCIIHKVEICRVCSTEIIDNMIYCPNHAYMGDSE